MDKLFPLLKKDELTQKEIGLNYPQTKGFLEAKLIKVTRTVHNGGRGRPSNVYSLTAKGRRQVEAFKADGGHTGARKRSGTAKKAPVKRGRPKVTASKTTAKPKVATKGRKATSSKPKVKVRARS